MVNTPEHAVFCHLGTGREDMEVGRASSTEKEEGRRFTMEEVGLDSEQ